MKNKYFYIKISVIGIMLMIILFWLLLFFFPANKYIYSSNKKIKELKRIVTKYKNDKKKFVTPNSVEYGLMQDMEKKFNKKFFIVKDKEGMIRFFRKIYDHIQYYENYKKSSVFDLRIITESNNNNRVMVGANMNQNEKIKDPLIIRIPDLKVQKISLSFKGSLAPTINFINHITWSDLFISINGVNLTQKEHKLDLKIYYIDKRKKANAEQ